MIKLELLKDKKKKKVKEQGIGLLKISAIAKHVKYIEKMKNMPKLVMKKNDFNPFEAEMKKIPEIKIFLCPGFHVSQISKNFWAGLEEQFATQMLLKMNMEPNKANIAEINKFIPLEECEVHLSMEQVRKNTFAKLLHVYPNNKIPKNQKDKLKNLLLSITEKSYY